MVHLRKYLFMVAIIFLSCFPQLSLSWTGNNWDNAQPDHRFGTIHNPLLGDEGYRWRNSLNVDIFNGATRLNITSWRFDPVIVWNNSRANFDDAEVYNNFSGGFDGVHNHLSKISWNALKKENELNDRQKHFACAAITIIVETRGGLKAYSKVLTKDGRVLCVLCAEGRRGFKDDVAAHFDITEVIGGPLEGNPKPTLVALNDKLNVNIDVNGTYGDCEGRIVRTILDNDNRILKNNISQLIKRAQPINGKDIKLVVFHIHTIKDPCAVCSRVLVGLSNKMNNNLSVTNINTILQDILPLDATHINSKFLVEVSSNEHYSCGQHCAHAECSGVDGGIANVPRINIGNTGVLAQSHLAIPFGVHQNVVLNQPDIPNHNNFIFDRTFPPYVIFSRTKIPGSAIVQINAPHQVGTNHAPHANPTPALSLIQ